MGSGTHVISAPRIFDNMPSSQPPAFNLFAELGADPSAATAVCRALWPDVLPTVDEIRFEWSPGRGDARYLGNRSVMTGAPWVDDFAARSLRPTGAA